MKLTSLPTTIYSVHPDIGVLTKYTLVKGGYDSKGEPEGKYISAYPWRIDYNEEGDAVQIFDDVAREGYGVTSLRLSFLNKELSGSFYPDMMFLDEQKAIEYSKERFDAAMPKGRVWKVVGYAQIYCEGLSYKEAITHKNWLNKAKGFAVYDVQHA